MGIAQGVATIGAISFERRRDYAAIVNGTNLAARLCSQAEGGQTLMCDVVAAHTSAPFDDQSMPPLTLKGFTEPVICFEMADPATPARA